MENEFKTIGRRIKLLRMSSNVSQSELAYKIGMSQTNLSNVEGGRTAATVQVLLKIRKVLGCRMSDFFVDLDGEADEALACNGYAEHDNAIELTDAVKILKLLKAVEIKGL